MAWVKVRGGCWSFCLYWWNWWPSLFKLSFHNVCTSYNNDLMKHKKIKCVHFLYFQRNLTEYYSAVDTENMMKLFARFVYIKIIYCNLIGWSAWRKNWLYLITWVGIGMTPTYSFANDKFKYSHEIIVIKIEESLNFVVKIKL